MNDHIDCKVCLGAEIPKESNMILTSILRHDLWNQKKSYQEQFSVQLKYNCGLGRKIELS